MAKKDKKKEDEAVIEPVGDQQPIEAPVTEDTGKTGKKGGKKEELDAHAIAVKVYSPYQVYFDGAAQSISAENDTGPFDILPRHHNFMTLVNPGEVVIRIDGEEDKKIRITRGVMHVRSNKVTLFLDV